ncbi:cytochrome c3 family protein [Candidatus Poribacteria bacterium]
MTRPKIACQKSRIGIIIVFMIIAAGIGVVIAEESHDDLIENGACVACHVIHKSFGPGFTEEADIVINLCKSCHVEDGEAPDHVVETHIVEVYGELSCALCHNPHEPEGNNIHLVKERIDIPSGGKKPVTFSSGTSADDFIRGEPSYDGICETCHTDTNYHRNNEGGDHTHYDTAVCITCHAHTGGFAGEGGGDSASHPAHTVSGNRSPEIDCDDCHDTNDYPNFISGTDSNGDEVYDLSETDVCDACHSPGGAYNGVNSDAGGSIGAKDNWAGGVYSDDALPEVMEKWCVGCHDDVPAIVNGVSAPDVSLFWTAGHGRGSSTVQCEICHDTTAIHFDGEARTYSFSADYAPAESGVAYAAGYRLKYVGDEVPLMIPANYQFTFGYDASLMKTNAFRLCFGCHDSDLILDDTPGDGIDSSFKASLPNPPRNYSYAWGSGADVNEHVAHIMNYIGPFADSDWDVATNGEGGFSGRDTMTACSACHNVHGATGAEGSTNEAMVRDGTLAGRTGYGFSYVIEDGTYPQVTSTGATQATSTGAIFRNNTANMCGGSMCHGSPTAPPASSYDASGSSWGTYIEYYRPHEEY